MENRPPQPTTTGLEADPHGAAFRTLAEYLGIGVVVLDPQGNPVQANAAARHLLCGPQTPDDGSDQPLSLPEELRTGPPGARSELDLDLATAGADGARRVRATRLPLAGDEGGALLLIEDRTRSEAARASLELASRLRTWSLFRFVHNLKQPLNVLSLQLELLKQPADSRPDARALAETALVEHVTKAQNEVLRFGRELDLLASLLAPPGGTATEAIDIGPFLADLVRRIASALQVARVRLDARIPEAPLEARVSRSHLQQALLEVFQNALQASARGGMLRLHARAADDAVLITIEDDGPGMSPAVLARAFELHFSTRPGATGIGLTVARSLLEESGARIELVSRDGAGTTVEISLPKG